MADPVLEYLKSIKQDLRDVRTDIFNILEGHEERIDAIEKIHYEQRGAFKMAVALFTGVSAIVSFVVSFVVGKMST